MKQMKKPNRLITVTRADLTSGYQTVQSAHAVADFAFKRPFRFLKWRIFGQYLISLAVPDLSKLNELCEVLKKEKVDFIRFYEPDIEEFTAICISPSTKGDRLTKALKLANRKEGKIDKPKHNGNNI